MKKLVALLALFVSFAAFADDAQYVAASKKAAGILLRASLNDPDSLVVESATIYRRNGPFANICGTLRAKNAFGGYVRQYFVVSEESGTYIGPIPPTYFKRECSGEVIE
jgi:hypothetical protein